MPLGEFLKGTDPSDFIISTKFTPQCANPEAENAVTAMYENSMKLLNVDAIDIFWIHNPVGAPDWTRKLVETAKEYDIGMIGVSNHDLSEIKEAKEILEDAGLKLGAIQNHYSLLNRSSEYSGILDYCKENDIVFFSYMVLEQGALCGKYDTQHPLPEGSDRANAYNGSLDKIEELNAALAEVAKNHDVEIPQIPIAWAINKGTLPIVGATKEHHVTDALKASEIVLTDEEINDLLHALLTFLLLLQQFALTAHVTAITLRQHILAHLLHRLTGDNLRTDSRLNGYIKLLTR